MPYRPEHKEETRVRIIECARRLFNRHGFSEVSIDQVMAEAGLTRGGFYNHFRNKEELFCEAVEFYATCDPSARWDGVDIDFEGERRTFAAQMVNAYLSRPHLEDLDYHCPMVALPSDIARAGPAMRETYQMLLQGMIGMFQSGVGGDDEAARRKAITIATLCIGGMVMARTVDDAGFANEVRETARDLALQIGAFDDPASSRAA